MTRRRVVLCDPPLKPHGTPATTRVTRPLRWDAATCAHPRPASALRCVPWASPTGFPARPAVPRFSRRRAWRPRPSRTRSLGRLRGLPPRRCRTVPEPSLRPKDNEMHISVKYFYRGGGWRMRDSQDHLPWNRRADAFRGRRASACRPGVAAGRAPGRRAARRVGAGDGTLRRTAALVRPQPPAIR